jgi:hypothetical protein
VGVKGVYLDDIAAAIRKHIPEEKLPKDNSDELIRLYAVLLRAKGAAVAQSDIHDAWSAWMRQRDPSHVSLVPYDSLPSHVRDEDHVFALAVRLAANELEKRTGSGPTFSEVLFPFGPPRTDSEREQVVDLYKVIVTSSEELVSRRQGVNTFFLTINGALLTASGIIVQASSSQKLAAIGVAVLAVAGAVLCGAWRGLITSFGQLNTGKFKVINTIESHLRAAIYSAEWEALGRGENPKVYKSFTAGEIWVPTLFFVLHVLTVIAAALVGLGLLRLGGSSVGIGELLL